MDLVFENLIWAEKHYNNQIQKGERELKRLPKGSLSRKQINGKFYYYHRQDGNVTLIKKNEESILDDLARAYYLRESLKIQKKNHYAISMCLKRYEMWVPEAMLDHLPDRYSALPKKTFYPQLASLSKTTFRENEKVHEVADGQKVRSKSETLIISILEKYNISYEYEPEIWIRGQCFHVDFKLISPRDNRTIIWEHFGRNDKQDYRDQTAGKIATYADYGIVLWDNFIATFDDKAGAINMMQIERIVKAFLL